MLRLSLLMSVNNNVEKSPRKSSPNSRNLIASLKIKNEILQNENTSLWAENKRLTDELEREQLNRIQQFFELKGNEKELDNLKKRQVNN